MAKGYYIKHLIKEIGFDVSNARPKLIKLLKQKDYHVLLAEHKGRLTRSGFLTIINFLLKEAFCFSLELANVEKRLPTKALSAYREVM